VVGRGHGAVGIDAVGIDRRRGRSGEGPTPALPVKMAMVRWPVGVWWPATSIALSVGSAPTGPCKSALAHRLNLDVLRVAGATNLSSEAVDVQHRSDDRGKLASLALDAPDEGHGTHVRDLVTIVHVA
jgi:hypothetical protein